MNEIEALITAARRYCIENHEYWVNEYAEKGSDSNSPYWDYSDADYNLFPRYNALSAILSGVEYIVGSTFESIGECKKQLIFLGENTDSIFTRGEKNDIEERAIQEERNKFREFIESVEIEGLGKVPSLPHRRRLGDDERNEIRNKLEEKWGYDGGYWFPLVDVSSSLSVMFLSKGCIEREDFLNISRFVGELAGKYIFEITEDQLDYEIDAKSLDIDCYETIMCDESLEWVLYGSHESTIAFGGDKLVEHVELIFKDRLGMINELPEYD